jgi:anti-sigma regulatory factor (Ser/Thr protein kinase)
MGRKGGTQMREQTFPATTEALNDAMAFVDETLEEAGCSMKVQMQIDIAVEEIFVNIAHYAYTPATGDAVVRVELQEDPRAVAITFEDSGVPYDPLAKEDPDVTLTAEERQIGGLGILLVRDLMDSINYERIEGKNILTLIKRIK